MIIEPVIGAVYRGRFAPSPTGPLHFGSLVSALGSYLDAKVHGGEWLVRIEDVDKLRCRPEHEAAILRTLERYGFRWDGAIMRQSERTEAYREALEGLLRKALIFGCSCTRKEIGDSTPGVDGASIYPGICRNSLPDGNKARSCRIRVPDRDISFVDEVQGVLTQNLARDVGDFVVLRADGLFTYQLAVVVDDAEQKVNHIVRGADLLDSTPRQLFLQQSLGLPPPQYAHLPVAVNEAGKKLSKQTLAVPLIDESPVPALWQALNFLGQHPPQELGKASLGEIWEWAMAHWSLSLVPKSRTAKINSEGI
jgi:glutamyl-Q tRNA(Asp) synthetase